MMTDWYERSTKALQLAGLANSSGAAYTGMLRQSTIPVYVPRREESA